jgi:hypothetical protein
MNALKVLIALAVAITMVSGVTAAYDGGDAVAIQSNDQSNSNAQIGSASAENSAEQEQSQEINLEIDFGDNGGPGDNPTNGGPGTNPGQ